MNFSQLFPFAPKKTQVVNELQQCTLLSHITMLFVTLLTLFVLYSMATNNSHIIILDSDQTFNNLFTTKTISHVDIKLWWTYLDYIQQHYLLRLQRTAFTISDQMHLVVHSRWISDSCFTATGNSSDEKVLTDPCRRIEYETWKIPPSLKDTHIDNSVVRLIGEVLSNEVWNPTYRVWRITAYHKGTDPRHIELCPQCE